MSAIERCPQCPTPLVGRVNQILGTVYLECSGCGYVEGVTRKPDPFPTTYGETVHADGRVQLRPIASGMPISRRGMLNRRKPEKSNARNKDKVVPPIDPRKAAVLTARNRGYWGKAS